MFLCAKCHKKEIINGCDNFHQSQSLGRCEDCTKLAVCVDCKFYRLPQARKRVVKKHRRS